MIKSQFVNQAMKDSKQKKEEEKDTNKYKYKWRTYGGEAVYVLCACLHCFAPAEVLQFHQSQHHLLPRHANRRTLFLVMVVEGD